MFCFLTDPRVASCKESENQEGKPPTEKTEAKTKREKQRKGMYQIIILQSEFR